VDEMVDVNFVNHLPHWATKLCTDGKLCVGAQLPTRDGRKIGNAYIIEDMGGVYNILTDAGTKLTITENEVHRLFYRPRYIADVQEVLKKFER